MMDDKDREVCAKLERDLRFGPEWEIQSRVFNDPGMTIKLLIYKETSLEAKATVEIRYGHREI